MDKGEEYFVIIIIDKVLEPRWFHETLLITAPVSKVNEELKQKLSKCHQNVKNIEWGRHDGDQENDDYGYWCDKQDEIHPLLKEVFDVDNWNPVSPFYGLQWNDLRTFTMEHSCTLIFL